MRRRRDSHGHKGYHKYKVGRGQVSSGQVKEVNQLKAALIFVAIVPEEGGHGVRLVKWARKVVRETASGDRGGNLGVVACRTANGSDPWTYESMVIL